MPPFVLALAAAVLAGCGLMSSPAPVAPVKDGELAAPANYRSWPKFLSAVQRPDAKQVREIYMNPAAAAGNAAAGFPNGSVLGMENFAAVANPDGTLQQGPDGKLVKGALLRVFVMGKGAGWGASAPEGLKNGDWIYAGWLPDGAKAPEPIAGCRGCHLPLAGKDFVHRYDEHFGQKSAGAGSRTSPGALRAVANESTPAVATLAALSR
jgi:hemoglobin